MKPTINRARKVLAALDTSTRLNAEVASVASALTESQYRSSQHLLDLTPRFYTYLLLDPTKPGDYKYRIAGKLLKLDYEPFYAGKGSSRRIGMHLWNAKALKDSTSHKENRIRKILRAGKEPIELKVSEDTIEAVAFAKEIVLIKYLGRRVDNSGVLTNQSIGGDGLAGIAKSPEHRQKLREANTGKVMSEEARNKLSLVGKGRAHSEEHKRSISEALKGRAKSADHRSALSKAKKSRTLSSAEKAHLQKISMANVGRKHSEESKRKRSEKLKGRAQPRLVCPHCGLEGAESAMKRWHFDNCRSR